MTCIRLLCATLLATVLAAADSPFVIVSSLPRTGGHAGQTASIANGIRLAIDEAGGSVAGHPIVYRDWDDATPERGTWDPAKESENAQKAAADPDVMAYIGTFNSGAAKVAMPILNKAGLAMVSPANTWPGLTKPGYGATEPGDYRPTGTVNYFRVVPADDLQGAAAANWAKELGAKAAFVLHDQETYGKGLADMFVKSAKRIGLGIAGFEAIDPKAANFRSMMNKVRAKGADLVFFGGTTQTGGPQIAKDMVAVGLAKVQLIVPDGCYETSFIEAAGAAACEGRVFATFGGVPPKELTGKGAEFVVRYRAAFKAEPEAYAVYGYECAKVVLAAAAKAGVKDRAAILAAIGQVRDYDGALGTWSFDANGDTTLTTLSGSVVKNGAWEFSRILSAK